MSAWSNRYVGLPYLDLGRERGGSDCWGLACVVYREVLGIRLPDYLGYASAHDLGEVAAVVTRATAQPLWLRQDGSGSPFDVAVFRRGNLDAHVGIVVRPGLMLHMAQGAHSVIESYQGGRWKHRLTGIYRHAELVARERIR